ncbi:MAG: hypothetical protein JW734_01255 [Candidatus Omnitrophica bacterium]|nr:hypothetical protein [Candidatus Omnitrophota bacterium]
MMNVQSLLNLQNLQSFFSRLSKREKMVLYGASFFIFLAFLDRAIIAPSLSKMETQENEIREKKLVIRKDLRIITLKDSIEEESKKYQTYFQQTGSIEEERTAVLKEVENLASESGVYLAYIRPQDIISEGPFKKIVINLNCEAEMPRIVGFLYAIESSTRLLTIDSYVISPKTEESSIAQCRIVVSKIVIP